MFFDHGPEEGPEEEGEEEMEEFLKANNNNELTKIDHKEL